MFKLGDVLKGVNDIWQTVEFPELCLGYYYREEEVWNKIEPRGPKWNIKKRRPFIIVKASCKHVYLILLTSAKDNPFPCKLDEIYGIGTRLPKANLKECDRSGEKCKWILEESSVFKRKIKQGECRIVVRISKMYLIYNTFICGKCSREVFDKQVWFIIKEELEGWKLKSSETC